MITIRRGAGQPHATDLSVVILRLSRIADVGASESIYLARQVLKRRATIHDSSLLAPKRSSEEGSCPRSFTRPCHPAGRLNGHEEGELSANDQIHFPERNE